MAENRSPADVDWVPYFAPMLGFALVLAVVDYAPPGWELALAAVRVVVPLGLFLWFFQRGSYPELRGFAPGAAGAASDVLVGLAVAALWTAPYLIWHGLRPEAGAAFDPAAAGEGNRLLMMGLRLAGFAAVTPFVEELLVRSFLMRYVDVFDTGEDFREIPIGRFAWRSFLATVAWFTFTHAQWEWPVALLTGVAYNLWLYRRKHIGSLIVVHATTNAALFAAAVFIQSDDLWFFL